MKAEELRLGNLLIDREGGLCEVVTLDKIEHDFPFLVNALAIKGGITSLPTLPIELTEEWLLKLGFEISTYHEVYIKNNIIIDKDFCLAIEDCYEGYLIDIGNELKYVHQVQNLYFALTGEELKINKL